MCSAVRWDKHPTALYPFRNVGQSCPMEDAFSHSKALLLGRMLWYSAGMRKQPITITCAGCKEPTKMHAYRVRKGTGKYCSQKCYLSHRWDGDRCCKQCGKTCSVRYCSDKCQKAYWNKNGAAVHKHPRNWQRKLALIESLGGKCVKCGFDDVRALDIDHIDPGGKIKPKTGYTWGRRFKDWAANNGNLRLLCANCHRLHTWEQRGFGRGLGLFDKEIRLPQGIRNALTCD